jgi:hypothetical protein
MDRQVSWLGFSLDAALGVSRTPFLCFVQLSFCLLFILFILGNFHFVFSMFFHPTRVGL